MAGSGTYTAALVVGRDDIQTPLATAELWNGSSWTEVTDLNTARRNGEGAAVTPQQLV